MTATDSDAMKGMRFADSCFEFVSNFVLWISNFRK